MGFFNVSCSLCTHKKWKLTIKRLIKANVFNTETLTNQTPIQTTYNESFSTTKQNIISREQLTRRDDDKAYNRLITTERYHTYQRPNTSPLNKKNYCEEGATRQYERKHKNAMNRTQWTQEKYITVVNK